MNGILTTCCLLLTMATTAVANELPTEIVLREFLVAPKVGAYGRGPLHRDPIDAAIADGSWKAPSDGDTLRAANGRTYRWRKLTTKPDGLVTAAETVGGYAMATVDSPAERIMVLDAAKHVAVCINGEWLAGDPYGTGTVRLPVQLKQGQNQLLFHLAQPGFRAKLVEVSDEAYFIAEEAVLPDFVTGDQSADPTNIEQWAALPVVNASSLPLTDALLIAQVGDGEPMAQPLGHIEPLSVHKVAFRIRASGESTQLKLTLLAPSDEEPAATETTNEAPEETSLKTGDAPAKENPETKPDGKTLASAEFDLRRVSPTDRRVCTFVSRIDGSVQPYAILPAIETDNQKNKPGIILTLHDLGVDCRDHVASYAAKPWAHIVAPQNRSRFGFDWEDWGSIDAIEALDDAAKRFPNNPRKTYLTGHSTGGHGVWLIGSQHPDRFAAIGPSAGWISYWTYGGGMPVYDQPTAIQSLLTRSASSSDPLRVLRNLTSTGVYVLHQTVNAKVSVSQSRFIRSRLGAFHQDFVYREDDQPRTSVPLIDTPDMMEFFERRELPESKRVKQIDFSTTNPGRSGDCYWARIESQIEPLETSRIMLSHEPSLRSFQGQTENVQQLTLDVSHLPANQPVPIKLDNSPPLVAKWPRQRRGATTIRISLAIDEDGVWRQTQVPTDSRRAARQKNADRSGGFKSVFDNRAQLVYGTIGTDEENRWAAAKARFDAQTFWSRGGGSLEVLPDTEFNSRAEPNRNVILYGNADTNAAWPALLSTCPVQIRRDRAFIGIRPESSTDLAVLMVRPRRGSRTAMVGVVGGTGIAGMRLTNRLRYFVAGVAYPDLMILGPQALTTGDPGVRALGYFGNDWSLDAGDIEWRDLAL